MTRATHHGISSQTPAVANAPSLEIVGGWKSFGHVTALRDVSITIEQGEVLALVGDNGAGKSTLVKVLAGVHNLDAGEVRLHGKPVEHNDPRVAKSLGIATVFQDLAIVETLDIAANMFLGQPKTKLGIFADRRTMIADAAQTLRDLKVRIPSVRVAAGELSGGQRQGVAIARAVRQNTPIILMDEPTAALGVRETAQVADIIETLRAQGKAVVIVCHDLEFIFSVADKIQVMRLGQVHALRRVSETNRQEVVGLITGALPADSRTEQL